MEKETVAVGDTVFIVAENGETLELTPDEEGKKNFVKALKGDWPEEELECETMVDPENLPDELCPFYKQEGSGCCEECGGTFADHVAAAREYDEVQDRDE